MSHHSDLSNQLAKDIATFATKLAAVASILGVVVGASIAYWRFVA